MTVKIIAEKNRSANFNTIFERERGFGDEGGGDDVYIKRRGKL